MKQYTNVIIVFIIIFKIRILFILEYLFVKAILLKCIIGGTGNINVPKDVLILKLNNDSLSHSSERKKKISINDRIFSKLNLPSIRFFLNNGFQFYLSQQLYESDEIYLFKE